MRPVSYVLWALLACWVGIGIFVYLRRRRVTFLEISSEDMPDDFFLKKMIPEGTPHLSDGEEEGAAFMEKVAETVSPDLPDQAILYIRDRNLYVVSMGIVSRIMRGDRMMLHRVNRLTGSHPDSYLMVANFGCKKTRVTGE